MLQIELLILQINLLGLHIDNFVQQNDYLDLTIDYYLIDTIWREGSKIQKYPGWISSKALSILLGYTNYYAEF